MEFTLLFSKIIGPLLLIRGVSLLIDQKHFLEILEGLEKEVNTISFSLFPVALFIVTTAIVLTHSDTSSIAALLIHLMAWGGMLKATALMLFPRLVVTKARMLGKAGFLNVVALMSLGVGGYFTWFGYCSSP